MDLPPNFQVGEANEGGDSFFYSVAQGLKQLKPELDFTVKSLRLVCKSFAQSQLGDEQSWFIGALKVKNQKISQYIFWIEFTANDDKEESHETLLFTHLPLPIWGRSEIEGRIICTEYDVKLHVVEKHIVEGKEIWTHQIVDSESSRPLDSLNCKNNANTVYVVNRGGLNFEPILKIKAVQGNKQRFSDLSDGEEEDVEITAGEELFYAIRSNDSEIKKVTKVKELFKRAPTLDINFQGINNDTCLHIAVRKKELKVIEFLVKKGARTDIKNYKNRSPLDVAKRLKRQDILRTLQPNVQNIFVDEQKERNQENGDGRNKKVDQENGISRLSDDELPSKKYINLHKDDQTTEGKYNKLTYEKRPETTGMHGQLYEINLLMLLLLRAEVKEKAKLINCFYLATNIQGAGAFDDVVFKYKYSEDGLEKSNIIFLQAKHKGAEKGKRLSIDTLLSKAGKGDFLLRKYLSSYIKIKQLKFKENHPLFLEGMDRSDFVIYTNAAWNFEKTSNCVEKVNFEPEDPLHFLENTRNYYYQLNANETLKTNLRLSLDFEILVRELAQSIYSGSIELSKLIFKDYHVSLAERVLQISETNEEESQLRRDFLDGTQDAEFSRAFLAEIRNNKDFSTTFSAKLDNELKEEIRKKIIKLPKNFGSAQDNLKLPLPNKTIPDEIIEEFLEKLKLFTDQNNVNDLEITIKKMIIKVFKIEEKDANLVYCDVYSKINKWWRKQKKVKYLTEHCKLFNNAKENLSILHLVGLAILYAKRFKSLGLSFKSDQIQRLLNLIKEKQILHIISYGDAVLLSTVKVYQAIQGMTEYKSEDDNYKYIFLSLTSALQLHYKVIGTFKSERRDLLIIECEGTEKNFEEFYVQLKNTVKQNKCKKIVLITRENDRFGEQFKRDFSRDNQYEEEIDRNNTLADLKIESQAFIEKKKVMFQGIEIELGTLIDEKSKHLVTADDLSKIINGERINVDKTPGDLGEVKYYYINRTFHHRVNIKKECFKEKNINNVFALSNVNDNEFLLLTGSKKVRKFKDTHPDRQNPERFIILDDDDNVQENLKRLYTKYQKFNIHWVKKESDKFIWQESHGSLSNLRKFVDTKAIIEYPADKITNTRNRIVIVSAEPGMGKSVLLTKLAGKEKETDPSIWVARINLSDFTKQLKEIHLDENNFNGTINFLSEILDLKTPLEKRLFQHRVENQGKVILLFDGFDEISPHYKEKVIALVKILKETKVNKLWITTRPHMRDELEDKLSVFSYSLKPLSTKDQTHFLKKFWSRKLDLKDDNDNKRLRTYIGELLKVWPLSIGDEERGFAGIPLQIKMLAEVYHDKFKEFYNSDQSIPSFPRQLNLLDLYQSFIDKKYDIYWVEKTKADTTIPTVDQVYKNNRSIFLLQHQLLALEMIISEQELNLLLDKNEKKDIINFKCGVINGLERTGIINMISNQTLNFIHRTFAEYFTALWLADNLEREEVTNLLNSKLFETENRVLRCFFDRILASGDNTRDKNEIHRAVLTNDIEKVKELCSVSTNSDVDKGGRTALHLAAAYGLSEIAEVILKNNKKAICIKDKIFRWRPLRYADKERHWHLAELLLQGGAIGDDMFNAISNISSANKNTSTLLHTAAKEGLFKLTKLLIQRKANINAKTEYNKTPLHYAVEKGNFDIVKLLIQKGANVHCPNMYGGTVLYCAASWGNLDVVKLLIEKGADIHCQNACGDSVLHSAAEGGNLGVVKLLIENTAEVRCQNIHGDSVLHYTARKDNCNVVKLLIEKGADIHCQNTEGDTTLHYAAFRGNLDVVKLLIEKGADIHCQNACGDSVLHCAAEGGNLDVVKFFIEKGADVHCQSRIGGTVLHYAARKGNLSVVKLLIEEGANVSCESRIAGTVLHCAAEGGNLDVVKFLIEKGADVHYCNRIGGTVLHSAARKGNLDVVKLLMEKGANVHCQNMYGDSILHCAARRGNLDVVKLLIEQGADVHCQNRIDSTVLHCAATKGNLDVVKFLIDKVANVNCQNAYGDSVLHCAARKGNLNVVKFLIEKGADIHNQNRIGDTILHCAARRGNCDVVKLLIEKSADIHCQNRIGDSVLHCAARKGNLNVVKLLMEKGTDVHCQNTGGNTALHATASKGHLNVVKLLIDKGANVHCQNKIGGTVLHCAASWGNLDVVKFLIEKGVDVHCISRTGGTVLHSAARKGNLGVVKLLIEEGANVQCQNIYGDSVLHSVARKGNLDVVKLLIEQGADVHCQSKIGDTVLHSAARKGNLDVVKLLIVKGADVQCHNTEGDSVLHCAARKGNFDVVKLLIEKGADIHCQNIYGDGVFHCAARRGNLDIVRFLVRKGADVKCQNKNGDNVLHCAARRGKLNIVKFLIEKGADFN